VTIDSADEFVRLRYSEDPLEYRRAAVEPAAIAVWIEVINRYPDARVWVAQNKTIQKEVISRLASDADSRVRYMISMKRSLTPELLGKLAMDSDETIRMRVAMHKNSTRETLRLLGDDPWKDIRNVISERLANLD
jgi:hypothetical protein